MQGSIANCFLGHSIYLIDFLARNKPLLTSNPKAVTKSVHLLVSLPISDNFPAKKKKTLTTDFRLSHYIQLNITSAKRSLFGVEKRHLGVMIILSYL